MEWDFEGTTVEDWKKNEGKGNRMKVIKKGFEGNIKVMRVKVRE